LSFDNDHTRESITPITFPTSSSTFSQQGKQGSTEEGIQQVIIIIIIIIIHYSSVYGPPTQIHHHASIGYGNQQIA